MSTLFSWDGWLPYLLALVAIVFLFIALRAIFRKKVPESRYVDALNAILEGDEAKALEDLRHTVQVERSNIDAYLRLGNLLRKRGAVNRALRIHRDLDVGTFFRRKLTAAEKFRIREAIADDYLAVRKSDEALAVLADLLKRDKLNRKIRSKMVAVHERRSEWDQAFRIYQEGFKARKENAPERVARYRAFCGASLLAAGESERAAAVFEDALRIDALCPEALFRLGQLRFEAGEMEEAIGFWKRFHEVAPDQAFLTFDQLERALYETGDLNSVEQVYGDILEKELNEEKTMLALSTFFLRRGQTDEALTLARRAAEKHPHSTLAQEHLLLLLSDMENESDAMGEIREYLKSRKSQDVGFVCDRCGHPSEDPFWRCPKCLNWNTARQTVQTRRAENSASSQG